MMTKYEKYTYEDKITKARLVCNFVHVFQWIYIFCITIKHKTIVISFILIGFLFFIFSIFQFLYIRQF